MRKKIGMAVIGLGSALLTVVATGSAQSHGYTNLPPSRQALCANGTVTNCGDIQYEPQSVEGPKGFPASGPADGTICAAWATAGSPSSTPRAVARGLPRR